MNEASPTLTGHSIDYLEKRNINPLLADELGVTGDNYFLYFPYYLNGRIVRIQSRNLTTKACFFLPKESDHKKLPFWNQKFFENKSYLIITEGQFDTLSLYSIGINNVVSLPCGASSVEKAFKDNYAFLQEFDLIFLCFDNDAAGEKAAKKAISMLPENKVRRIILPAKDANEWIMQEEDVDIVQFTQYFMNAERFTSEVLFPMEEFDDKIFEEINLGTPTNIHELDSHIGGIRKGEVTVISADTGAGKTTFSLVLAKIMKEAGLNVWINSYEMSHEIIHRKLASQLIGKNFKLKSLYDDEIVRYRAWLKDNGKMYINKSSAAVNIFTLKEQLEKAALAYKIDFVVIDHLDYLHSAGKHEKIFENIEEVMRQLHIYAMEYQVHIVLVAHPHQMKAKEPITMSNLKGSSAIKQYGDNVWLLTRMDRIDSEKVNSVRLQVCKNRLLGNEGFVYLNYNSEKDSFN